VGLYHNLFKSVLRNEINIKNLVVIAQFSPTISVLIALTGKKDKYLTCNCMQEFIWTSKERVL
jgi:hypothetical protein